MPQTKKPCSTMTKSVTEKSLFEDEALELMWELKEHGDINIEDVKKELGDSDSIERMQSDGLIYIKDDNVSFTDDGLCRARDITRRHLLAERLFADVLALNEYEEDACRFEHAISPEVEEAICTLLGHPPTCPHGRAIPRGECCKIYSKKVKPLVHSLTDSEIGAEAKIVFITSEPIDRLSSMGLTPGAVVKLIQKRPTYVLGIDETTVAMDEDIAKGIYVKR